MQTQDRVKVNQVATAIAASQQYLLSIQNPAGYWWAELESNVTITAEVVLLHKIWGTDQGRPLHKVAAYLRQEQRQHGGWELFYGDGGELSTSVEAYMALRLLGVPATDPAMVRARKFILQRYQQNSDFYQVTPSLDWLLQLARYSLATTLDNAVAQSFPS
jgi:squalene-hopene/tetraprenyl-beta-curcumene cyclase